MADPTVLSRSDRLGMYLSALLGGGAIVAVAWSVIARLVEVAPGSDVPVLVPFLGETATLPIGPDGDAVRVAVDQAVVTVPEPAAATLFALWAEPIVLGIGRMALIALAALFCLRLARGKAFQRGTARLVYAAVVVLAVGWLIGSLLTAMTVNGALSAVSDYSYDGVIAPTDLSYVFGIFALTALGVAFQLGERMQRETEGLV